MDFRVLGPLEVLRGGRPVELGGPKQRTLLVVLLLRANEVVSQDKLIDALWEEAVPPTAAKTLQAHVSRLRKTLANGRLETHGHGYLLRIGAGELDAEVFSARLEAARSALADGDPQAAKERIREALELWRGGPLADVAYESFAQAEIQRFEELRLAAQEEWFEAELALGRHTEILPELKRQQSAHPLRERLLGQLMIALYRSDRQAEALQTYEQGRRALAEELGLEPSKRLRSLERRILEHDPGLAAPPRRGRPTLVPPSVWRRPRRVALLGAVVALIAIAVAVVQASVLESDARSLADVEGNALAAFDTRSGHVENAVASPTPPTAIAVGYGLVWAASADGSNVVALDPKTSTVRDTIPVESAPGGIAIGGGWVWVTNSLTGTVSQISPRTLTVVQPIRVGNGPTGIAADSRYVWVANTSDHTVSKLRASDGKVLRTFPAGPDPGAVAVGESAVWVASKLSSVIVKLNPTTGEVVDRIPVGDGPAGISVGDGSVWVANSLSGTVTRIDPQTGDVRRTVEVGASADAIAVSGDSAWVASVLGEKLVRIPFRDGPLRTIAVSDRPTALAVSEGKIYAGFRPGGASHFGGTLRVLFDTGGPAALDTANAYDPDWWGILILTNDGLVGWRRAGGQAGAELVPNLAVSLPTVSADRRTYTFQLRRGIRYSDGRLVKASDVRYSFERLYKLKSRQPPAVDFYRAIVGADRCAKQPSLCDLSAGIVTDDRAGTVSFRLATADPEFLFKLAAPFASVLPAGTSLRAAVLRPLPATGPYRVASASRTGSVRLVRNPHFEEWSSVAQPRGFADEILIRSVAEGERADRLVAKGKADYVGIAPDRRAGVAPIYETQLHIQPLAATFYLALDTTRPPFNDVRARRALNYAVDRSNIVRLADGSGRATCQVLPPNFPAFKPHCPYTLGPGGAMWRAPDSGRAASLVRASRTRGAHVELWWHRGFGEQIGRDIERVLDSLGYRVRLRLFSDYGRYFTGLHAPSGSWHVAGTAWFADYPAPSNFIRLLSCSSDDNYSRFCDEEIDRRIDSAFRLQERDPAAANRAWAALDRDLTDQAPWVPLYTPYSGDFVSKRVGNYQKHPFFGPLFGQFWVR